MTVDSPVNRIRHRGVLWQGWCDAAQPRSYRGPVDGYRMGPWWLQCHQWNASGNWFWQFWCPTVRLWNTQTSNRNPCCKVFAWQDSSWCWIQQWLPTSNSFLNTPLRVTTSLDHAPVYSRILKSERHFEWKWGGGRYPNGSEYGRYTWVYNGIHISCKIGCQ